MCRHLAALQTNLAARAWDLNDLAERFTRLTPHSPAEAMVTLLDGDIPASALGAGGGVAVFPAPPGIDPFCDGLFPFMLSGAAPPDHQ